MTTKLRVILLAQSIILLAACGGGGGSSFMPPPEPLYSVGGTVTGLNQGDLELINNGGDNLTVAGTSFEFATGLTDGSSYDVNLERHPSTQICAVESGTGTISGADVDSVNVLCKSWGTAGPVSGNGIAGHVRIAFDGSGNAVAVWRQNDGSNDSIFANRYTLEGGWGLAELIETETGTGNAGLPEVAVDDSGNAISVWRQWDGVYDSIWANTYTVATGDWGTADVIETNDGDSPDDPKVAVASNGDAIAVWEQYDDTYHSIWVNHYTAETGNWDGAAQIVDVIEGLPTSSTSLQVAVNDSGDAILIWSQDDGTGTENKNIYAKYYTAGVWGSTELVENNSGSAGFPQVAFDGGGNAMAVWRQGSGGLSSIYANRYTETDGWGEATLIEDNSPRADIPQIALDSSGNAMAVWQQQSNSYYSIYANRYIAGSGWGDAELLENDDAGHAHSPQVTFDGSGNAITVWHQYDGTRYNQWANRYTPEDGWGTAILVEDGDDSSASAPRIASDHNGNATAVWSQDESIQTNRFE